jgi:hypothetical protein
MKQKIPAIIAFGLLVLCGCASGTHIVTGTKRAPIKPEQVVLYQIPPAKFEIIGIVNAQSPGNRQRNMDNAIEELKKQAGEIGANGILLGGVTPGSQSVGVGTGTGYGGGSTFTGTSVGLSESAIQVSGQAIYATP